MKKVLSILVAAFVFVLGGCVNKIDRKVTLEGIETFRSSPSYQELIILKFKDESPKIDNSAIFLWNVEQELRDFLGTLKAGDSIIFKGKEVRFGRARSHEIDEMIRLPDGAIYPKHK